MAIDNGICVVMNKNESIGNKEQHIPAVSCKDYENDSISRIHFHP